jgi:hypothetical protein
MPVATKSGRATARSGSPDAVAPRPAASGVSTRRPSIVGCADLRDYQPFGQPGSSTRAVRVLVARPRDGRFEFRVRTDLRDEAEVTLAPIPISDVERTVLMPVGGLGLPRPLELVHVTEKPELLRSDLDEAVGLWCWMQRHRVERVVELVNGRLVRARVVDGQLQARGATEAWVDMDHALVTVAWDEMDDAERAKLWESIEESLRSEHE